MLRTWLSCEESNARQCIWGAVPRDSVFQTNSAVWAVTLGGLRNPQVAGRPTLEKSTAEAPLEETLGRFLVCVMWLLMSG